MKHSWVQGPALTGEDGEMVHRLRMLELEEAWHASPNPSFYRFLGTKKKGG